MNIDPKKTLWKKEYGGKTYYFCSEYCLKAFEDNPAKYAGK